ncbi:MAG: tetratricopeptide repeat protein [Paracoccaceae bacterium]
MKKIFGKAETGKLIISGIAVCVDHTGIAAASLGADALIHVRDTLFQKNPGLAELAQEIDNEFTTKLNSPAYDKPTDARQVLPDMLKIALAQPSDLVEHDLDASAILKTLNERFQSSDAEVEHKRSDMITAFNRLYGPILETACNDPRLKQALDPALHRQDAQRQKEQNEKLDQIIAAAQQNPNLSLEARELARQEKLIRNIAENHLQNSPDDPLIALEEIRKVLETYAADLKHATAGSNLPDQIQQSLDTSHAFALKGELGNARATISSTEESIADQERVLQAARHRLLERRFSIAALEGKPDQAAQIEIERLALDAPVTVSVLAMVSRAVELEAEFNRYGNFFHGLTAKSLLEIALEQSTPEDQPDVILGQLAIATSSLGQRTSGTMLLAQAVDLYREHQNMVPRALLPHDWAMTQNNLGIALREQGNRTEGPKGADLLEQAVTACRAALEVYTEIKHPVNWATTQNNLGNALGLQGRRTEGSKGADLLEQAVTAYRAALQVHTRTDHPVDWAGTQNNLGDTLRDQSNRTEGSKSTDLLGQAVTACRAALEVYTRTDHPVKWAMTQNNLGAALGDQGKRTKGPQSVVLLEQAVTAMRAALEVRTRTDHPVKWAMTQNNLGAALGAQGKRTEGSKGADLLEQAVTAYRAALEVYTRTDHPVDWAMTQTNIAITLKDRALRSDTKDSGTDLAAALDAVDLALEVFDPEHMSYRHGEAIDLRQLILSDIDALSDPKS